MAFYLSLVICVVSRLIPHPVNFTPLGSLIYFNARKSSLVKGIALAVLAMVITDIFLNFNFASLAVYLGFITYALFGRIKRLHPIIGVTFGSISFFVISNFGVWLGPWYTHDLSGLVSCFVNALPFYRNTILSDLGFVILILGVQHAYKIYKNKLPEGLSWQKKLVLAISRRK